MLTLYDSWLAKHAHPEATAQWVCEDVKSLPIRISRDGEEKQSIDRSIGEEEYFAAGGDLDDGEEVDDDDASALSTNRIREQYLAAQTPRESWRRMSVMRRPREKRVCPPDAAT